MQSSQQVFEVEALLRVATLYRERLRSDPADMAARTGLAWSLFLQSLIQAGQEQLLGPSTSIEPQTEPNEPCIERCTERDARGLLTECLQQVTMVRQLSEHPRDRADMDRLHTLIRLAGEAHAVCAAEDEATRILGEVTRAILEGDPSEPCRPTRSRRRSARPRPEV
jgi:hypothetical protein